MKKNWMAWIYCLLLTAVIRCHLKRTEPLFIEEVAFGMAIPLFAMFAGFSIGGLLRKTKGIGVLSGVKLFLFPYLFWTLVYIVLNNFILDVIIRKQSLNYSATDFISAVFFATGSVHTWFLAALIYVFIFHIALRKILSSDRAYKIAVLGVVCGAFLLHGRSFFNVCILTHFFGSEFMYVLSYFTLGVAFSLPKIKMYSSVFMVRYVLPIGSVIAVLSLLFLEVKISSRIFGVTLFLTTLVLPNVPTPRMLFAVLPYTMGIYLTHLLFTSAIGVFLEVFGTGSICWIYAWPLAFMLFWCTWFVVWVSRKIPGLKNFV